MMCTVFENHFNKVSFLEFPALYLNLGHFWRKNSNVRHVWRFSYTVFPTIVLFMYLNHDPPFIHSDPNFKKMDK